MPLQPAPDPIPDNGVYSVELNLSVPDSNASSVGLSLQIGVSQSGTDPVDQEVMDAWFDTFVTHLNSSPGTVQYLLAQKIINFSRLWAPTEE